MFKSIVCTIYEKDYEYGIGALLNSLIAVGFRGKIIILYGDKKPFWLNQLQNAGENQYVLEDNIEVEFRKISSELHFTYYKPYLISDMMNEFPNCNIYYFDPDITVIGDWKFFEDWVDYGVALCLDQCYPLVPVIHPLKRSWQKIFASLNYSLFNLNDYYFNAGFIGVRPEHKVLIERWKTFTTFLKGNGHSLTGIKPSQHTYIKQSRLNAFCSDQDVLNAALMYSDVELSVIGQEGMGFIPAGYLMNHNVGVKTWQKKFVKHFFVTGLKFTPIDQSYFNNSFKPINLYTDYQRTFKNVDRFLTKIFQRIF